PEKTGTVRIFGGKMAKKAAYLPWVLRAQRFGELVNPPSLLQRFQAFFWNSSTAFSPFLLCPGLISLFLLEGSGC
ncbi:hypothetical protein ACQP3C_29780, partial [Escherichia coli]